MSVVIAVFLLACGGGAAQAQNSVRGPVGAPVPLTFNDGQGNPAGQANPAPAPQTPAAESKADAPQPKFPNKDTAKNRQDYEMGTDTGSIQLGRDEATGDTTLRHNPPKKEQQPYPIEQQPINVWPVVPGRHR
ncbi:MAG TPA: hypothetical protein VN419_09645 [Humidesulfovibrio sp.]|nr:hypothetical protein [Humidesulfovibrio sp.]